jgi:hypothetical protein
LGIKVNIEEFINAHLTERSAKEHIELNGHNIRGMVDIYAVSMFRCPEMIRLREILLSLIKK